MIVCDTKDPGKARLAYYEELKRFVRLK